MSVLEGLLTKSDQKLVSILALLDLSAAFDTLDHAILLRRHESTSGISGVALCWFKSYLSDRTQSVMVDGAKSTPIPLVFGVPQGSVLRPVLFTLYSQPLSDVKSCHSCDYHKYADDTEISDSAPPSDFTSAQSNIQSCISDTLSWMQSNKLKLSRENKRDEPSVRISSVGCESADIGGSTFSSQTTVTYLGVHLDQTLSMKQTHQPLPHYVSCTQENRIYPSDPVLTWMPCCVLIILTIREFHRHGQL